MFYQANEDLNHLFTQQAFLKKIKNPETINEILETCNLSIYAGLYKITGNPYSLNLLNKKLQAIKIDDYDSLTYEQVFGIGQPVVNFIFGNLKSAVIIDGASTHRLSNKVFEEILAYLFGICLIKIQKDYQFSLKQTEELVNFINESFDSKYREAPSKFQKIIQILNFTYEVHESFSVGASSFSIFLSRAKSIILSRIFWVLAFILFFASFLVLNFLKSQEEENIAEKKSLNEKRLEFLKDSLNEAKIKTEILNNDSVETFFLGENQTINIAKSSSLHQIIQYLADSTQKEPLELMVYELRFSNSNDEISEINPQYLADLNRILSYYSSVTIYLKAFSDNGQSSAEKRALFLKNRLIGEGLSVKRIQIMAQSSSSANPLYSTNSQVFFKLTK